MCLRDGLQRGVREVEASLAPDALASPAILRDATGDIDADVAPAAHEDVVVTEVRRRKPRLGPRLKTEKYPFGTMGVSRDVDGWLEGESFLIPYEDAPKRRIAAGRKRHKVAGKRFLTASEDDGVRVWRER